MKISVVVPVYNSEDCLEELVSRINSAVKQCEIILVNDNSKDNSWELIETLSRKVKNIVGLNLRKNFGQDGALMAGLNEAKGDYVVIMDDDLQHDPADIPILLEKITESDADVCCAKFRTKKQALWKNLGSWFNGKIAEIAINKPAGVYLSPYKMISRSLVKEVLQYPGPYPYVDGLLYRYSSHFVYIEVEHHERFSGSSNYNLVRSIRVFLKLVTSFSIFPLRFATFAGFFSSLMALLLALFFIGEYILVGTAVTGWMSQVLIMLFLGGLILSCLGIIGEYIGRSYMVLNRAPQFSVRDRVGKVNQKNSR